MKERRRDAAVSDVWTDDVLTAGSLAACSFCVEVPAGPAWFTRNVSQNVDGEPSTAPLHPPVSSHAGRTSIDAESQTMGGGGFLQSPILI